MNSGVNHQDGRTPEISKGDDRAEDIREENTATRCAYFYYVTPSKERRAHDHLDVEAFLMQEVEIGSTDILEDLIPTWAKRAKAGEMTPVGWALGDLRWRRKSYLVVVLDAPAFKFGSPDALVISNSNHTFGHKALIDVTTDDGSEMQAIYCLNHVVKEGGGPWKHNEVDEFRPLRLELMPANPLAGPIITHDDVGTNVGPRKL